MNSTVGEVGVETSPRRQQSGSSRFKIVFASCLALLVVSCTLSLCLGPVKIGVIDVIHALFSAGSASSEVDTIVRQVRLPRILLAAGVGIALAASGTAFQSLLRNDLADPYILGISSGASTAVAAVSLLTIVARYAGVVVPLSAFAGSLLVLLLVVGLSSKQGRIDSRSLLLTGVIVGSFFSAVELACLRLAGYNFEQIMNWLMGSLAAATWQNDIFIGIVAILCLLVLLYLSPAMNLYAIGEESARQLGLDAERFKRTLVVTATVLAAASVAVAGIIGFIGLIAPHMARRLLKTPDHRCTLPVACLCGATLLVWSDTGARVLFGGDLLPVGVLTAFLGAPFFCYQLSRR